MISKIYNYFFPLLTHDERINIWLNKIQKSKYYVNDNITHEYLDSHNIPRRTFFLKNKNKI